MIKDKIKALLKLSGKTNKDGAKALDMPYYSFTNKINQREFTTSDLIKIGNETNTKLAFINEENKPIIIFEIDDIN